MRLYSRQTTILIAAAILTSCVGVQTARQAKATPLFYTPSCFPCMTAPVARQYVRDQLIQWRTATGPIKSVRVNTFSVDLLDGRGHVSRLVLDKVELADVVNHTMDVGNVTLIGGKQTQSADVRKLADALKFLKSVAPYEPEQTSAR